MPSRNAEIKSLYRDVSRAALLGFAINLALGITKLIAGLVGHSFALLADALNSLADVLTSVVVLIAVKVAQQPPDEEHPYGHTRAEAIAGSNVALFVVLSALAIGWEAIEQIGVDHELPPTWTLWIAGLNVALKEGLYQYKIRVGRRTGSTAISANAWDHRADALSALAVLIGLALVRWGGPRFMAADGIAALVVVAVILYFGVSLFRRSVNELMDVQAEEPLLAEVRQATAEVPGVLGVEKLWIRKSGLEYLADIHIEVDPQLPVSEGHRISHRVKDELMVRFPRLRNVLVHLEPHRDGRVRA